MSLFTITFCSHNKPIHCRETIESILAQTYTDWTCIINDSGVLYDQGYFSCLKDPRFIVHRSSETEEMRRTLNMASWLFNRVETASEWIMFLCDDDLLYPEALQGFYEYIAEHKDVCAMYQGGRFSGPNQPFQYNKADVIRGRCVGGARLDCLIDGGQICIKTELLSRHKWPEEREHSGHADGIFLERVGCEVPFMPIDQLGLHNRKIPGLSLRA